MAAFPLGAAGRVLDWRQAGSDPKATFERIFIRAGIAREVDIRTIGVIGAATVAKRPSEQIGRRTLFDLMP